MISQGDVSHSQHNSDSNVIPPGGYGSAGKVNSNLEVAKRFSFVL
jgi:hypothetical protein